MFQKAKIKPVTDMTVAVSSCQLQTVSRATVTDVKAAIFTCRLQTSGAPQHRLICIRWRRQSSREEGDCVWSVIYTDNKRTWWKNKHFMPSVYSRVLPPGGLRFTLSVVYCAPDVRVLRSSRRKTRRGRQRNMATDNVVYVTNSAET